MSFLYASIVLIVIAAALLVFKVAAAAAEVALYLGIAAFVVAVLFRLLGKGDRI